MDKEWIEYEHQAVQYHQQTYGHTVWHNDVIPEEELMNAGFIHDFNRHRLCRIARRREAQGKAVKYNDYGMDFLSKDVNGNYHACQAKHYRKRKVVANDLGSFQSVVYCRIKNTGYLYTSGDIEVNLKEDIMNSNGMLVHHNLPFHKHNIPQATIDNSMNEPNYELRTYQRDAIEAILQDVNDDCVYNIEEYTDDDSQGEDNPHNRKVLELFCGGGKTVIAGHVLQRSSYDLILCIAPLRVSVDQLKTRLTPFIPSYEVLLVDSDEGGITDVDKVKDIIENRNKPMVIFSTFNSTENVLTHVITSFSHNMFLLVDEVHNILSKDNLCQFANRFHNSLLLSATIPEELYDVLDANKCFTYGISDAIKNGYCCDYEVFLPYIDRDINEIDVTTPLELTKYDKSLSAKAMFLATGMLKTGSRRCIVYLASHDECDKFLEVAKIAFEEYHGISFWGAKIDSTVSGNKRRDIINEFQSYCVDIPFRIIASVRILDEAVDIPKCDSEFITVVGDQTSDIRTVQRLCRGCRLDANNPCKTNNLFMWCSDWSKAINCLTLLKDADPNFNKKVRVVHANYDTQITDVVRKKLCAQETALYKYINIKCLGLAERWEIRRQEWIHQYSKLGRRSSSSSKDQAEQKAGTWQTTMRQAKKGQGLTKLTQSQIEILDATEGWLWEEPDSFEQQYNNWIDQYSKLGRKPRRNKNETNQLEHKAAMWQNIMRMSNKGIGHWTLTPEQIEKLDATEGWTWEEPDKFVQQYDNWVEQYSKLGRKPSSRSKNKLEARAGQWQQTMRHKRKQEGDSGLTSHQIETLNNTEGWTWQEQDTFECQYNNWVEQYAPLGDKPSSSSSHKLERRAGQWQQTMRQAKKSKGHTQLTQAQIDILDATQGWTWEERDAFNEQYKNWVEQYTKLGRKPSTHAQDESEQKAAIWQGTMRQARKGNGLTKITQQQIDILDGTQGWTWEERDTFNEQYNNWVKQYSKLGAKPSSKAKDELEKNAGLWQIRMRMAKRVGPWKITPEQIETLDATEGWTWEEDDSFPTQYANWVKQYAKLGHKPSSSSKDENERRAGQWQTALRQIKKGKRFRTLTDHQIEVLNNTEGWTWQEPDTFAPQYDNWLAQYMKLSHKPSPSSKDMLEKKAGVWQGCMRMAKRGLGTWKISPQQIEILNNTEGWTWEEPEAFTKQYSNWVEQYSKLGRKPSSTSKNEDEKRAGIWQCTMRLSKKGKGKTKLSEQQIEILNNTEGWTWDG